MIRRPWLDNLWRWKCGLPEHDLEPKKSPPPDAIGKHQMYAEFTAMMRNALINGYFRYGGKRGEGYDLVEAMKKRLATYVESNDATLLVDIANFAMYEYRKQQRYNRKQFLANLNKGKVVHVRRKEN